VNEQNHRSPQDCDIEQILRPHVGFVRLMGDDTLLSHTLLQELALRGIDPACASRFGAEQPDCFGGGFNRHRIAIVSEWDSPYQRALRYTLERSIRERCEIRHQHDRRCEESDASKHGDWLVRFSYLRGIDGQTSDPADGLRKSSDETKAKPKDPMQPLGEVETIERADGNTQFDYVRRLAERIERRDRELQQKGESGIGAIGVLGSDPYDKLTILQALHERFPERVFFTTNLDARLIHPQESKWARNLVVVSDFDLELNPGLQRDIPPLRDAYQTAALFATQFVMRTDSLSSSYDEVLRLRCKAFAGVGLPCDNLTNVPSARPWFAPLVFEIGRTHAIRMAQPFDGSTPAAKECQKWNWHCTEVQPPLRPTHATIPPRLELLSASVSGLLVGLIGLLLVHGAKPNPPQSNSHPYALIRVRVVLVVLLGILAALITLRWSAMMQWITENGMGEPAAVFEGISIWPAQVIRLLIITLGIVFLFRSHNRLRTNRNDIVRDFGLPPCDNGIDDGSSRFPESTPLRKRIAAYVNAWLLSTWHCIRDTLIIKPAADSRDIERLWTYYLAEGRACARLCRVFCFGVLFTALSVCALLIWPDFVRFRGEFSYEFNRVVFIVCLVTFNFLLFYVIDALIICARCVKRLVSGLDWPARSFEKFQDQLGRDTPLKEWMTLQLIARRTEAVGSLVYMPFVLVFLIIIARNSVFERWSFPPSILASLSLSVALIVFAAMRLRTTTESARSIALGSLTDQLIAAKGKGEDQRASQLELMMEEVRNLRRGAFAPYTEQKFIRALLLPLAGYAGSALIEYLSLVRP
jgi:hypothetical protein